MTQVSSFTQAHAKFCKDNIGKVCITARHDYGVEIHDMRVFRERMNNAIGSRGIVYTFGATHIGITPNKLESICLRMPVVEIETEL